MASPNALAAGLAGYNFMLTPQANAQLRDVALQQAYAQSLMQQGAQGVDVNNRQIGGVGYNVSPLEGLNKVAEALVGAYETKDATKKYNDVFVPPTSNTDATPAQGYAALPDQQTSPQLPPDPQQQPSQQGAGWQSPINPSYAQGITDLARRSGVDPNIMMNTIQDPSAAGRIIASLGPTPEMKNAQYAYGPQGAPGAVNDIMNYQRNPGAKTYQEGLANAAVGMAPAGTLPTGVGGAPQGPGGGTGYQLPPPVTQGAVTPLKGGVMGQAPVGMRITDQGIVLDTPAPPEKVMDAAVQTAGRAIPGGGGAPQPIGSGGPAPLPAINPAGMTTAQYQAAVAAQKAGAEENAKERGKNLATAQTSADSIDSRIGTAKDTLQHIIDIAPRTSYGMAIGTKEDFANQFNGKLAADNADFTNASARLFLQELPAVMSSLSNRGNQFMERQIQEAGSIDLNMHPDAKVRVAQRLVKALDQAKQMQDTNVTLQGGQPTNSVQWVIGPNGQLTRQ